MGSSFKVVINKYMQLKKALNFLKDNEVYVGVPDSTTDRELEDGEEPKLTNADLLFIHTKGSPVNNIPARPVIEPALADDKERISEYLKNAAVFSLDGKEDEAQKQLSLAGLRGQNVSRNWFVNPKNNWKPNSPATIRYKRRKGSTEPKPLIDTGELRKSITYFVSYKGVRRK